MPPGGWIRVERRLHDPTYLLAGKYAGLEYKSAWIDLIGMASHQPHHGLGRGQLRASQRYLAARWGWGLRRVNTFLRTLEDAGMVEHTRQQKGKHLPTILTICNYDRYQTVARNEETLKETRVETRMETTSETKTTKNKKQETKQTSLLPAVANETPVVIRGGEVIGKVEGTNFPTNGPRTPRSPVPALLGLWIDTLVVKPTQAEIRKQSGAVKRMVGSHGAFETAEAFVGMQYLYAFREGIFDAFDVERQFTKARQAYAQNELVVDTEVDWSWLFDKGAT